MLTVQALRARCTIDPATHCWLWQGAVDPKGSPRFHTLDYARCEKRVLSGPLAAWNIAYGEAPRPGWLVYRCCGGGRCLNPAHLRQVRNRAEMGEAIRLSGRLKGQHLEARRASAAAGWKAQGIVPTPPELVRLIRATPSSTTHTEVGALHGVKHQTVSRIRRGLSHRGVA